MRDIEDKEMPFGQLLLVTGAVILFMAIAVAALSEMNRGDEFPPCSEHKEVDCG